jgi:hypothetical protein
MPSAQGRTVRAAGIDRHAESAALDDRARVVLSRGAALSEQDWTVLLQVAKDAAAKLGAKDVQVMQDQPGKHAIGFRQALHRDSKLPMA